MLDYAEVNVGFSMTLSLRLQVRIGVVSIFRPSTIDTVEQRHTFCMSHMEVT